MAQNQPPQAKADPEITELRILLGHKLIAVRREGGEDSCPILIFDNGLAIAIQCDPEGNGPGFGALCKI